MNPIQPIARQAGFSLVELCAGLAVSSILMSQAIPGMQELRQRKALEAHAQTVYVDLQQARSEAVMRGQSVQMRFSQHSQGSCYLIHTGASGDCRCSDAGEAVCRASAQPLKLEWLPASRQVAVRANVGNLNFQARQGTVSSAGSVDVALADGRAIRHVVSIAGRVRSCSPDGLVKPLPRC
ncbi:MAG: GspH/FimT family pseudopilin [Burkholderiaceae bacterium]